MIRTTTLVLPFTIAFSILSLSACGTSENERDQSDKQPLTCTVVTIDDDSYAIRCPDGSEAIVKNGSTGQPGEKGEQGEASDDSCTLDTSDDGNDVLTCGDKSIVLGNNCEGGFPGSLSFSGEDISDGTDNLGILTLLGCTAIQGDVTFFYMDERGLPPEFDRIQSIGGSLQLTTSFETQKLDLPNLKSVGQDILIASNDVLTELTFPALESVGGSLILGSSPNSWPGGHNPMLETIAFPKLTEIGQDLSLYGNDSLQSLSGLSSLLTIGRNLEIQSNHMLTSIEGINGLTHIEESALLFSNESLNRCEAVAQLEQLPGFEPDKRSDDKIILDIDIATLECP